MKKWWKRSSTAWNQAFIMKHRPDLSPRMKGLKNFSSYVNLCTKVCHNFGCHMTPAEFYVSSDALVHLQVSTEYLIARAVEQLAGCLAQQAKVKQSRSKYNRQATPTRRVKMYYEYLIRWCNRFKPGELSESPLWPCYGEDWSCVLY